MGREFVGRRAPERGQVARRRGTDVHDPSRDLAPRPQPAAVAADMHAFEHTERVRGDDLAATRIRRAESANPTSLAGPQAASSSPASTRIRRATTRPSDELVIRREIGTVPAPYRPLQKGEQRASPAQRGPVDLDRSTSLEDFAEFASAKYQSYVGNDDIMLDILLGPFEANWFKAKACLTMGQWPKHCKVTPEHEVGVKLMDALVRMRKAKWTEFVTTVVQPQFRERMAMFGAIQGPLVDHPKMPPARSVQDMATAPKDHPPDSHGVADPASLGVDLQADLDDQQKKDAGVDGAKSLQSIFPSVGAEAVTSDVDLASGGSNSELGVQFVNSRFRTHFVPGRVIPYDPGTVFDINLYASDWIHGVAGEESSQVAAGTKVTITPRAEVPNMSADDTAERSRRMEVWSLVKVRRNLTDKEWETYAGTIVSSLHGDEAIVMHDKLAEADDEHEKFKAAVEARQRKMMASITAQEQAFFHSRPTAFDEEEATAHFAADAHATRASNAIYEEHLQKVKELRLQIRELQADPVKNAAEISTLGRQVADKIAEALTYANEVYATEGAVQHTVLKQGAAKEAGKRGVAEVDYALGPELYVQSVNENVGDAIHSLHHFEDVPPYAVYRAGKYLSRLCDAAKLLLGERVGTLPDSEEIHEIATLSVALKKKTTVLKDERTRKFGIPESRAGGMKDSMEKEDDRTYNIEGDPDFVRGDDFFGKFKDSDAKKVKAMIIAFGAAVPKALAEQRAEKERLAQAAEEKRKQVVGEHQ